MLLQDWQEQILTHAADNNDSSILLSTLYTIICIHDAMNRAIIVALTAFDLIVNRAANDDSRTNLTRSFKCFRVVLAIALIYLSCIHFHRQIYDYGSYTLDITGAFNSRSTSLIPIRFGYFFLFEEEYILLRTPRFTSQ